MPETVSFCQADLHTNMDALVQNFQAIRKLQAIQTNNDNASDNQIFNTWTIENFCKYMYLVIRYNGIMEGRSSTDRGHRVYIILGQNVHVHVVSAVWFQTSCHNNFL